MLSKTIQSLTYLLLEYRFYFFSIILLLVLLIYNHKKTQALEKELVRISKNFIKIKSLPKDGKRHIMKK
jgi:hypothetical protein